MEETMKPIRPLGISILSWLHILGGAGAGIAMLFLGSQSANPEAQESVAATGISSGLPVFVAVLLCALSFACGVGMWTGRLWGWYLGSFYWMYTILKSVNALIPMPSLGSQCRSMKSQTCRTAQFTTTSHTEFV